MKAVVLDSYPLVKDDLNYDFLNKYCDEVEIYERTSKEEVIDRLKDADICFTNKVVIDKEVMDNTNLKYISVTATGFNNVDINYAHQKNILVTNVSNYSTDFVAEHTISFILYALHQVAYHNETISKWVNNQDFSYSLTPLRELKGKTVGIIGYGNIAKKVIKILEAFEAKVIIYNRTKYDDGRCFVSLDTLLSTSDIISCHAPLNESFNGLFNKDTLSKVKNGLILVNTARGGFVVEDDIQDAINKGKIAYYLTDVLGKEAPDNDKFISNERVIVTPHIAWASFEARTRLIKMLEENLVGYINNNYINQI